ncbi:MAG: thiamine-phosphate kinase [Cyanobacteria bacterium HKST-UBA04]|nr:thiamine-phosphate kinase [Cyanobacteria bacterium HKST-UBA04]
MKQPTALNTEQQWIACLQHRFSGSDFGHDTHYDPSSRQVLTTDVLVEGQHFALSGSQSTMALADVGWRSVAASISDLASAGACPAWMMVGVVVPAPAHDGLEALGALYDGVEAASRHFACPLVGGDTVGGSQWMVTVSMGGQMEAGAKVGRRDGAQAGDVVAISGPHGRSAAGLAAIRAGLGTEFEALVLAHRRPNPPLSLGMQLAGTVQHRAVMDSSDGLADALLRLAAASQVDMVLAADQLPLQPDLLALADRLGVDPLDWVLYGGEDFELVLCLPEADVRRYPALTVVGRLKPSTGQGGQVWLDGQGGRVCLEAKRCYDHFSSCPPVAQ